MKLTGFFSRIKADIPFRGQNGSGGPQDVFPGGGRSVPFKKGNPFDPSQPVSAEKVRQLFTENHMPEPFEFQGEQYFFTGKIGYNDEHDSIVFEYSDYGEENESRLWLTTNQEVIPD